MTWRGRGGRGQSFVEFALILPVVLLLLLMAADLGRVFLAIVELNNTARVGARYAAANPGATYSQATYQGQINAEWAGIDCGGPGGAPPPIPIPDPVYSGRAIGDPVTVTLQCTFTVITPLIGDIIGKYPVLTAQATLPVTSCDQTSGSTTNSVCLPPPTAPPVTPPVPTPTPCPPGTSTIAANPTSQSGIPGASLQYQITVTNNTNASQSYVLSYNFIGSPWTASFSQTNITVPACGGTITSTLTVTSPAGASQQTKQIAVFAGSLTTTVAYVLTTCDKAPTVAATPASDTGLAGGPVTYAVTVTNNDPAGCGNRIFNLSAAVPKNWTAVFAPTSLSIPPNGSANSNVVVTSDPAATQGPVTVTLTATDPKGSASTTVTYIVATCTVAPGLTATPTSQTGLAGSTNVGYTVTVTNNDPIGCAARAFGLSASFSGGGVTAAKWSATFSPSSVTVSPNASSNSIMAVTSDSGAANGTQATITIASGGSTFQVTYIVARCDVAPDISALPTSQNGIDGSQLHYTITVTSKDATGCSPRSFGLTVSAAPRNWTTALSPTAVTLGPTQSGTSTLSVTSPAGTAASNNQITVASGTSTVTVTYTVVNCTAAPTITVNPNSQSGLPGTPLQYTVTVANNDPQPCTSRSFPLSTTGVPSGWTATFAPNSLTVSAGSALQTTLTVTSSSNAGSATVTMSVTTTGASKSFTYVVTGCDQTPSLAANPTQVTVAATKPAAYVITVTNNDPIGCASRSFALTATFTTTSTGWTATLSPTSVTVAPGNQGTSTLTITSPSGATGSKTVSVATSGATVNVTYNVLNCSNAPTVTSSPTTQSGAAGSSLQYTITVKNNDPVGCSDRTFNATASVASPNTNWTTSFSQTSLTIAAGGSAQTILTVKSSGSASSGTSKQITVTVGGVGIIVVYNVL